MKQKKKSILFSILLILLIGLYILIQTSKTSVTTLYVDNYASLNEGKFSVKEAQNFYQNNSIIGYIKIPGTKIHHFFVQGDNNNFYLDHGLKKEKSILGTIFMDYRNTVYDKQINLYGHNGNYEKAPFYDLSSYKNKEFYDKNPYIYLTLKETEKKYKIVSVIITPQREHMNLKVTEKKVNYFKENHLYETGQDLTVDDSILVLQTCTYEKENTYLLIVAKEEKGEII